MVCQGENRSQTTGSYWRAIYNLGGEYKQERSQATLKTTFTKSAKVAL
ncbi:MAG: hypothetical protein HWQ23_04515 [Nostoc sp. JL33]|nr:hypothetical protein [Nostoc sp. JL33]MBN3869582.1 hypothetical protein [Nostoc sp. JL33]